MKRRDFIAGLGGAAVWPVVAEAQQANRMRRIGVLMGFGDNDPRARGWFSGFTQALGESGWIEGSNLRMEVRWAAGNIDRMRAFAKEFADLQLDLVVGATTRAAVALSQEVRTVPIVFVLVDDPVGEGFIKSVSRPGGNITGFIADEASMGGKWLELLTEIAPNVRRAAMIFNPDTGPGGGSFFRPSFEAAAELLKVTPIVSPVHSEAEIESAIISLGREPRGGLVVMPDSFLAVHRASIILQAAQNKVPAVYSNIVFAADGGLLSYGPDYRDVFQRAAAYVDRILKGETAAGLPVQLPVKFEMAINAKSAKALGVIVPQSILLRADEVIE
jgi:putative tryptophan/tyrosine transport system substrate-binding protein